MTNKLKQIEGKLASLRKIANIPNGWQESTDEVEMLIEALSLLKEVEEGKAHVMRWVEIDELDYKGKVLCGVDKNCIPFCANKVGQEFIILTHNEDDNPFVRSSKKVRFSSQQKPTRFATFNNNNGEIPMPKEGE